MTTTIAIIGLVVSGGALGVAGASASFAWKQLHLAQRQHERDYEATVVVELVEFRRRPEYLEYEVCVTNAGPAVARDVDVALVEWTDESELGRRIHDAAVAPALLRGEQRRVVLKLRSEDARFRDRTRSLEVYGYYYDDNGVRNERLAFVSDKSLLLTPPQPPLREG